MNRNPVLLGKTQIPATGHWPRVLLDFFMYCMIAFLSYICLQSMLQGTKYENHIFKGTCGKEISKTNSNQPVHAELLGKK